VNKTAIIGCAAILSVTVAGCSSSKTTSSPSAPVTSVISTPSSSAPSSAGAAAPASSTGPSSDAAGAGTAKLAAMVLMASDLPAGWTATPHKLDPKAATEQAALAQCVGGPNTAAAQVSEYHSPDFGLNGASVSSSASSFTSQAAVNVDVALLHSPKISSCYQRLIKAQLAASLPAGATVNAVTLTIVPGSHGGPSNIAGLGGGTITATAAGRKIPIYLAVAFITGPLTEATVDFVNPTQPIPAAMFTSLARTVAGRAAHG
jgi:hypothetical protein